MSALTPEQRRANLKLALVLVSVALVFGVGFFIKALFLGA
jgi:hypothetical protein